jgi:hypothetical protein
MFMGVVMGVYVPLNTYARNSDCFSLLLNRADTFIQWHKYFDAFPAAPLGRAKFGLTMAIGAYNLYKGQGTCRDQYDAAKTTDWGSWYSLHTEMNEFYEVDIDESEHKLTTYGRTESGIKPLQDLFTIYNIFTTWQKAKNMPDERFYWYQKGYFPSRVLSMSTLLVFNIFQDLDIVQPMNAWDRYRNLW